MMRTFKGGIRIDDHKASTSGISIRVLDGAPEHVYPLWQRSGVQLTPLVRVSERVKVGQKIADTDAYVSAPLHASVSGTVTAIEPRLYPTGVKVNSIVVENDGLYEVDASVRPRGEIESLLPEEIINIVRQAGIVGMGGAGFPTHVKLSPPKDKKIDHIIINGSECEPYLTSDHRVMVETPELVVMGLRAVMRVFGLNEGYIAIEDNKPDAIARIKEHSRSHRGISVVTLNTKYPQGSEKQLIYSVTKKQVPSGGLPADVGAVVLNVDTAVAIATAIKTGMPLIRRIVTVSGDAIAKPGNFAVRLGAPFSYVIEQAGGFAKDPDKVIMGGPMMGIAQSSLDVPVVKGTSAILAFSKAMSIYDEDARCIRCGKCVAACPMGLMPLYLNLYAKRGDWEMCEKYNILDCIECGICSYLCPGRQHPLQNLLVAKQMVLDKKRAQKK